MKNDYQSLRLIVGLLLELKEVINSKKEKNHNWKFYKDN